MPLRPALVVMDYRGGERFRRCLASVERAGQHFSRIVISVTAPADSDDMRIASEFRERLIDHVPPVEVLCTGLELPTMRHQSFWVDYLEQTGFRPSDWIMWLAYDDEIRARGIEALVDADGSWPLEEGTAYFGPWAIRHERADGLWQGDPAALVESWTSFPLAGPTRLAVGDWIGRQFEQPTYLQMSGSLMTFRSFLDLRDGLPRKRGPMRIEMAAAATSPNRHVAEFAQPITIIYGRSDSDRASYGNAARKEDCHLVAWLVRYAVLRPSAIPDLLLGGMRAAMAYILVALGLRRRETESWIVRGSVAP